MATVVDSCIDSTPCKMVGPTAVCLAGVTPPSGGTNISNTCWRTQSSYSCNNNTTAANPSCDTLVAKGCEFLSNQCDPTTMTNGVCQNYIGTYQCITSPQTSHQQQSCTTSTVCSQGNCWSTATTPNTAFGASVTAMEIVREASVYGDADGNIFSGTPNSCRYGDLGLKDCCKPTGGAQTNKQVLNPSGGGSALGQFATSTAMSVGGSAAWYYAKPLAQQGSQYAYDFMQTASKTAQDGIQAMIGNGAAAGEQLISNTAGDAVKEYAANAGASSGFGAMGFTYGGSSAMAAGDMGLEAGSTLSGAGTFGTDSYFLGNGFAFDPTSLAISVAIMVAMKVYESMTSCTQDEMVLDMNIGANLCVPVGSYCSKSYPLLGCFEWTQGFCCYNSVLSKIINQQGRGQIGKGFGSPQNPDCSGFSIAQLSQLNFASMDFSQFIASINPDIPDSSALGQTVSSRVSSNISSGQGTGSGTFNTVTPAK